MDEGQMVSTLTCINTETGDPVEVGNAGESHENQENQGQEGGENQVTTVSDDKVPDPGGDDSAKDDVCDVSTAVTEAEHKHEAIHSKEENFGDDEMTPAETEKETSDAIDMVNFSTNKLPYVTSTMQIIYQSI